jgi:hypothetical protein
VNLCGILHQCARLTTHVGSSRAPIQGNPAARIQTGEAVDVHRSALMQSHMLRMLSVTGTREH